MFSLQQLTNVQARDAAERLSRDAVPAAAMTGAIQDVRSAVKPASSSNGANGDNVKLSARASGYNELKSATTGLAKIAEKLNVMAKLAERASAKDVTEEERKSLQEDFSKARDEMEDIEKRTLTGDRPLLDGSVKGKKAVTVGLGRAARLGESVTTELPDVRTKSLGRPGARVADLNLLTEDGAKQAKEVLSESIESISKHQARLAGVLDKVETAMRAPDLGSAKEAQLRKDAALQLGRRQSAVKSEVYSSLGAPRELGSRATQVFGSVAKETQPASEQKDHPVPPEPGTNLKVSA